MPLSYENFAKDIHAIIQAKLISEKKTNDPHVIFGKIIHYHLHELIDKFDANELEICTIYKEVHALEEFPFPNPLNPDADNMATDASDTPPAPAVPQAQAIELRDLARTCLNTIVAAIIRPHQMYFDRLEEIEIDISLKKLHFTSTNEDASAAAKARLDLEDTAPPELVKALIRGQVAEDTQNLKSKVGQLERQIASLTKNAKKPRGGPSGGASNPKQITPRTQKKAKKKRTSPTSPANGNRAKQGQRAGARDNATNANSKKRSLVKKQTRKAQRS